MMKNFDISDQMYRYRDFLLTSWSAVDAILMKHDWDDDPYFLDDWLSMNLDLLVKRQVVKTYESLTSSEATHIFCIFEHEVKSLDKRPILSPNIQYIFNSFVSKKDNAFGIYPPFDCVKITDSKNKESSIVSLRSVRFLVASCE